MIVTNPRLLRLFGFVPLNESCRVEMPWSYWLWCLWRKWTRGFRC